MERIHPAAASLVRRVLYWTIYADTRLSIKELIHATSVDIGAESFDFDNTVDEDIIRSACSSLLRRVGGDRLEIAHFTVQEYLQGIDASDSTIGKFSINKDDAHNALGSVCLTYLCLPDFDRPPPATIAEREIRNQTHPFYACAVESWSIYARRCWENENILFLSRRLFKPSKSYNFIAFCLEYLASYLIEEYSTENDWRQLVDNVASGDLRPLHIASTMYLPTLCRYLIEEGSDVNHASALGTPLQFAIYGKYWLFGKDPDVDPLAQGWDGISDTVAALANAGATFQLYDNERDCSLSLLAFQGDLGQSGVFRCLLDSGMPIDSDLLDWLESSDKETALKFFDKLKGATLVEISPMTKTRLLELASVSGIRVPQVLQPGNTEVESMPDDQFTAAFYHAIRFDQAAEIEKLMADERITTGIHLHHFDRKPLHYAAENRSLQVMSLLLNAGASEESTMEKVSGMTVWHVAARYGGKDTLELLLARFGDKAPGLTEKSDADTSPLAEAILGGNQDSALLLVELTRPDSCNPDEPPLIHLSTTFGMSKLTTRLIEAGFDPKVTSQNGSHALFAVSHITPLDLVETLRSHGLTPEHKRDDGKTCLHAFLSLDERRSPHIADISSLKEPIVKELVSSSVIRILDEDGNDPFHYFCTSYLQNSGLTEDCDRLCRLLIDHDALVVHEQVTSKSALALLIRSWFSAPWDQVVELHRAAQLFHHCINHQQALETFWRDEQSSHLLSWSFRDHHTLTNILLEKGVDVHGRSTSDDGRSGLENTCPGTH